MAESLKTTTSYEVDVGEGDDENELIGVAPSVAYEEVSPAHRFEPGSGKTPPDARAQELSAYLHALDVLTEALREGEVRAGAALVRMGRALELGSASADEPELRSVAVELGRGAPDELLDTAEKLRAAIHARLQEWVSRPGETDTGFSVLIVDDDPVQARLLEATLKNADREVTSVDSVAAAKEKIGRESIDLVVVDRMLGDGDGHELLVNIRSQPAHSNVPVMVLSANASDADVTEAYALGADAYLSKQTSPKVIAAAVSAHLSRAAQRKQAVLRDPDTGVRTRTVFLEAYEHQAHLSTRRGAPLTLSAISIDRFRRLVDLHGTEAGRRVAGAVAQVIRSDTRSSDIVGRWGSDVFVVAFPDTDVGGAQIALSKLWDGFAKLRIPLPAGAAAAVTASGGIVGLWEAAGDTGGQVERVLRRLTMARRAGRGRVVTSDDPTVRSKMPVLLIEDDELTAELIVHRLEREGFDVIHFEHGADALAAANDLDVVLAIVDVSMPGANGYEILLRLRETGAYASVPILMMTQGPDAQTARAFRLGATDVLRKPFAPSELLARVNRLV